jgi:hypothetical protein
MHASTGHKDEVRTTPESLPEQLGIFDHPPSSLSIVVGTTRQTDQRNE